MHGSPPPSENGPAPLNFPEAPPPPVLGPAGAYGPPQPTSPAYGPETPATYATPPPGPAYAPAPPPQPPGPMTGAGRPLPGGPGLPPGPPLRPAKSGKGGLIVMIVALAAVVVCGGGGFAGYYFIFGGDSDVEEALDDEPNYPQEYTPTVPAAPSGSAGDSIDAAGADHLCDHMDLERVNQLLYGRTSDAEGSLNDYGDSTSYGCWMPLSNEASHPRTGANGSIEVLVQHFDEESRAEQDFGTNKSDLASDPAVPTDGLELEAFAVDASEEATRRIKMFAVDGPVLYTCYLEATRLDDTAPPNIPAAVMGAMCVDYINEVATDITS